MKKSAQLLLILLATIFLFSCGKSELPKLDYPTSETIIADINSKSAAYKAIDFKQEALEYLPDYPTAEPSDGVVLIYGVTTGEDDVTGVFETPQVIYYAVQDNKLVFERTVFTNPEDFEKALKRLK